MNLEQTNPMSEVTDTPLEMKNFNPAVVAYGVNRLCDIPEVKETIDDCKHEFMEGIASVGEKISDFCESVKDSVIDFCHDTFEDVKDFFTDENDTKALDEFGPEFNEARNFGISECTEAAREIFNEGVINEWPNLTPEQRRDIACAYAAEVAAAFQLENYEGVYIEPMEDGTLGYNNGDGSIHLSDVLISPYASPLEIMNTITHELRHQYQSEAILGLHDEVPESVRNEWAVAQQIYNYDSPSCYDPWGYTYNPLEIDARFAGESVVRNVTNGIINDLVA